MKKSLSIVLMTLLFALCAMNAMATSYDYADATGYDNNGVYATNATWNRLGTTWTGEAGASAVAGNTDTDDGVSWSINGGTYGHDSITVGDNVIFKFELSKVEWGRHQSDYVVAWIDWNNDKDFTDAGEKIFAVSYQNTPNNDADGSPSQFLNADHSAKIVGTYYTQSFDNFLGGEYWLRARAVCNADAGSLDSVSSMGGYYQGEIEDWKLTVNNQVPEPASMLLLGLGLFGLAGVRRKMKK